MVHISRQLVLRPLKWRLVKLIYKKSFIFCILKRCLERVSRGLCFTGIVILDFPHFFLKHLYYSGFVYGIFEIRLFIIAFNTYNKLKSGILSFHTFSKYNLSQIFPLFFYNEVFYFIYFSFACIWGYLLLPTSVLGDCCINYLQFLH